MIRPAVVVDDGPPTLAQRIMGSRAATVNGHTNGTGNGTNGTRATNGSNGSNGSDATNRSNGSNGAQSRPSAGQPNAGQPFRNGQPRPAAPPSSPPAYAEPAHAAPSAPLGQQPATYSPVPGAPAAPPARANVTPSAAPATQPSAPPVEAKKKSDPFSAWRKPATRADAPAPPAAGAPSAAAVVAPPAARQAAAVPAETLTTGRAAVGGAVATGHVARGVPTPAPKSSTSAPASAASAGTAPKSDKAVVRRTRKARLRLSRVDPWSVMKTAFMFSIAAGIVLVVAVYSLWNVIQASDMFTAVNQMVQDAVGTQGDTTPFQLEQYINTPKVMGATALIAAIDVMLVTALATLTAFLYNLSASVLGGLEVTLAED